MLRLIEDNPNIILGIIIFTFLIIVLLISIKKSKDYMSYKKSLYVIGIGILDLLAGVLINSVDIGLWGLKTITSFFLLKTDFLLFVIIGYALVIIGIFQLILAYINRSRNINNNHGRRVY